MSGSIWRVPARVYRRNVADLAVFVDGWDSDVAIVFDASNVTEDVLDALDEYYKNPERVVVIEVSANLGAENAEDVSVELGGLLVVPDDDFLL